MRASAAIVPWLCLAAACAPDEPFQARFAVRGRWPGERRIGYRLEPDPGPLPPAAFARAIEDALAQWQAAGAAEFRPAGPGEVPALVFAWKRGAHGACTPFGADPSVAHGGPVGPGTFVHFDAGREWERGPETLSLRQAALHEVGHVLGLDHSPDEDALMFPEPARARTRFAASDLAALHSLYGGGEARAGDLVVTRADGSEALTLHAVAPRALCGWTVFDCDGDGDEEVLVWRTDPAGFGALWVHRFGRGPLLERTLGPAYGVALPGAALATARGGQGERLLVLLPPDGAPQVRAFDASGLVQTFEGPVPDLAPSAGADWSERRGDLDGDGQIELVHRRE